MRRGADARAAASNVPATELELEQARRVGHECGVAAAFRVLAAGAAASVLLVTAAAAGPPGRWSTLAEGPGVPGGGANEVALARTGDGTLHVAWREDTGPLTAVIRTRPISRAGRPGATATAVAGFGLAADPALVASAGGVRLFFAAGTPTEGLLSATAPGSAGPWSGPALVINAELSRARTPAVTLDAGGTPWQTWYSGGGIAVHRGTSPGAVHVLGGTGTNARPTIAADATGRIWVAWCRFGGPEPTGTIAQQVDPATGAPVGAQIQLPGSATTYQDQAYSTCVLDATVARHTPLVARAGGGVYAAGTRGYPTQRAVTVWRLDADVTRRTDVGAGRLGVANPALAAAPDGRIWVAWLDRAPGGTRIMARRSNRAGTAFGAVVIARPPGGISSGSLNLSAQADRADLIVLAQAPSGARRIQHTQLLPGLTLVRASVQRQGTSGSLVTFRANDAGEPLAGVRGRAEGRTAVTAANGVARLRLRPGSRRVTSAGTRAGYVGARLVFACC